MQNQSLSIDSFISILGGRKQGSGCICHCPAHDDQNPSLSIQITNNGKILVKCHAGCEQTKLIVALKEKNLWPQTQPFRKKVVKTFDWIYLDPLLQPSLKVTRLDFDDSTKSYFQSHFENGEWVTGGQKRAILPYRFNEHCMPETEIIFIVEGEKCADALIEKGFQATTSPGGAEKWPNYFGLYFLGKKVVILPDNDEPGFKHALQVFNSVANFASSSKIVSLPNLQKGGDIADYLVKNSNTAQFKEYIESSLHCSHNPFLGSEIKNTSYDLKPDLDKSPQPLFRELPEPRPFPINSLGKLLSAAAQALSEITKTPQALCGQSILAAAALALQPFKNIAIDGRSYPISNFFLTIGESGERKSAVDNEALKMHRIFEKEEIEKYNANLRKYKIEEDAYNIQRKNISNKSTMSQTEITQKLQDLGSPPSPPASQIMLIQEPTFEGLFKLLETGRPSVGLFSDEGGRMIGGHGMNEDNQLKTMGGFCNLWDGKPLSRVRSEAGSTNLYGKRFSLHLMLQPIVALKLTSNSLASKQGFLARCLIAFPTSTVGTRLYEEINISSDQRLQNFHQRISEVLKHPLPVAGERFNELNPGKIELSKEAKNEWIIFHNAVEKNLAENGDFYSIRGFGAKAAEHALRIAAILTLVENINASIIEESIMKSAIDLMHFYLSEALRLYNTSSINPDLLEADKLRKWCNEKGPFVHLTQIYKFGPNSLRDKKSAEKAVHILEGHGYLTPIEGGMKIDDSHRNKVWKVENNGQSQIDKIANPAISAADLCIHSEEPQKPQEKQHAIIFTDSEKASKGIGSIE